MVPGATRHPIRVQGIERAVSVALSRFTADGRTNSAHSPEPFQEHPAKLVPAIPAIVTYGFERNGLVTVRAKGATTVVETWPGVAITPDRQDAHLRIFVKRGGLVMTLAGRNGQPLVLRPLRKSGT